MTSTSMGQISSAYSRPCVRPLESVAIARMPTKFHSTIMILPSNSLCSRVPHSLGTMYRKAPIWAMLSQRKSTPLVCIWRTRPNSSHGIPAKASGLIISMAAIRPIKSAMVSQKIADNNQLRVALCSAVNTPAVTVFTSLKSLLMRQAPPEALVRDHTPGQDDGPRGDKYENPQRDEVHQPVLGDAG